jgi:hypothetical protein
MKKLKVGYWPLSQNLQSAGDRRRIVFWAHARGHEIVTDLSQSVDVIIASENTDFNSENISKRKSPLIFDLVDAYLSPLNVFEDLARGVAKKFSGQISGEVKPFSKHVKDFCLEADAVICSSTEQKKIISPYNPNTHVILDSHDEVPFIKPIQPKHMKSNEFGILWEGQPATIRGVRQVSSTLAQLAITTRLQLNFVTDEKYFQFLGRHFQRDTLALLRRDIQEVHDKINIIPWSPNNLVETAKNSSVAMIPIDLSVPMQRLKPENRLLIMWRLGLPCLCSASPAYIRVSEAAGVSSTCENESDWHRKFTNLLNDPSFAHEEIVRGQDYLHLYHNRITLLNKWDFAVESVMG